MKFITAQLHDRESVHLAAEGLKPCDIGEIERLDGYLNTIPLHSLPYSLVTHTMVLGATVRQFKEKVSMALRLHRQMNAEMFEDFFRTTTELTASIDATCDEIAIELKHLEQSED